MCKKTRNDNKDKIPLSSLSSSETNYLVSKWMDERDEAESNYPENMIGLFKTKTPNETEAVTTLYACWEEILNSSASFSKPALIKKFFEWSEEKRKFSERQVSQVIEWIQRQGIHP